MKLTKAIRRAVFSEMGKVGGAARAKNLTPARRKAIAKKANQARWNKRTKATAE